MRCLIQAPGRKVTLLPIMTAILLFLVCPVWAQYPSTGGSWTQSQPTYAFSQPPTGSNWAPYPSSAPTGYSAGGSNFGGTLKGTVKITFTWSGGTSNEPAPKSVIVTETMKPTAGAFQGSGSGTSSTNTGLANNATTRYEVKTPSGGTFTVTSPTMTASVSGWNGSAFLGLGMTASASNVIVTLTGTTTVNNVLKVLTGQQLTATLNTGYPLVNAQGAQTNKPTWSFATGGTICFGDFYRQVAKTYNNAGEVDKALIELGAAPTAFPASFVADQVAGALAVDFDVPSLRFYTKADGTVKVRATATVKFPDNTTAAVTGESRDVVSIRPTTSWVVRTGDDKFNDGVVPQPTPANRANFGLFYVDGDPTRPQGQDWKAKIDIPDDHFKTVGGQGCFAQLVTPGRWAKRHNPEQEYWNPNNGLPCLDATFPYGNFTLSPTAGDPWHVDSFNFAATTFGVIGLYPSGSPGDEYSLRGRSGDSPNQGLPADPDLYESSVRGTSYQCWVLFQPYTVQSGQLCTWVPMRVYTWTWSGTSTRDTSTGFWGDLTDKSVPPLDPTTTNTYEHIKWKRVNNLPNLVPHTP